MNIIQTTDSLNAGRLKINENFEKSFIHESTQWSKTLSAGVTITDGATLNLFTLLDNTVDKVAGGTTTRSQLDIITNKIIIPYIGKPYEGQRLHHAIRVNFDVGAGTDHTFLVQLRRANDTIIGSGKRAFRDADNGSYFDDFVSYTANALDPFPTIGFYIAIQNNSGATITLLAGSSVGILIQTTYEKPTLFL